MLLVWPVKHSLKPAVTLADIKFAQAWILHCMLSGKEKLHGSPLPQVIKRTGVQMQQRQVPAATVASWQHRVEKLEPQVCRLVCILVGRAGGQAEWCLIG